MKKIKAIILDWAGTTVDFGCFAPVNAFIKAFETYGITPTMDETRAPMGMEKRAHIAKMLEGERLSKEWEKKHGKPPTEKKINKIYNKFEPALFESLSDYTEPLPGVIETVKKIRDMGIVIGSTTGYTRAMMEVVASLAKKKGYSPDYLVCPEEADGGRPCPYMIWRNLRKLKISDIREVIKIGDTAADMEEGKNAGCVCVGVLIGSSMLGLSEKEIEQMSEDTLTPILAQAKEKYFKAGADYVINDITELPDLIISIDERMQNHV